MWLLVAVLFTSVCELFALSGQSLEEAKNHWAFRPLASVTPPAVPEGESVQSPIDTFLLSALRSNHLAFAPPAERRTLLRRTFYDLTGLPPTFEQVAAFEKDTSKEAFAHVVEQLLGSPRYGERWARHWLDVARYADTKDLVLTYGKDALRPYAYTYRDYVIRAFNEDLPYNQFVEDQLAADLKTPAIPKWRLAALGFLTLGRMFDNNPHDQLDDQIDTTTRGFLALTVACARCHNHKYDAISQADYYGLYGVFASTERPYDQPLLEDPKDVPGGVEFEQQLTKARKELDDHVAAEFKKLTEDFRQRVGDYLVRAATTEPDLWEITQFGLSLVPTDFRPGLVQRARRLLERRLNPADRIFGPWAQYATLADQNFAAEAAKLVLTNSSAYNPLVIAALARPSLTNKASLAHTYAALLHDTYEESKKPAAGSPKGGLSAEQKELLELVTGPESPVWFPLRDTPDHMSRAEKDKWGGMVSNLDKLAAHATNRPPARAMVIADLPEPMQPHIFKRGNPARPGEEVPRAFVRLLSGGQAEPFKHGSGRLELAQRIASPTNPLTARVLVNRVWMHHFGEPLVASTTDFGARSDRPSHPELLDWLARDFIESGWNIKHLHRRIVLSRAYQQSSAASATAQQLDPENRLLSHFARRRLDLESMRDTLLFVSGQLEEKMGGPSVDFANEPLSRRRTIYGIVDRQNLPALYRAFDFAIPDQCAERRPRTSTPQQALFAMNSPFVAEQARALAVREQVKSAATDEEKVKLLFRMVVAREATGKEIASAKKFLSTASPGEEKDTPPPLEQFAQILLVCNEAIFID